MASTEIELDRVCATREKIASCGLEIDAILSAYDGITSLLLTVLHEVREMKGAENA